MCYKMSAMKNFFAKRGTSKSSSSELPSDDSWSIGGNSPVVLRRPQTISFDVSPLSKSGASISHNASISSLPSLRYDTVCFCECILSFL